MLIFLCLSHRLLELPDHLLSPSSGDVKSTSQDRASQATYTGCTQVPPFKLSSSMLKPFSGGSESVEYS